MIIFFINQYWSSEKRLLNVIINKLFIHAFVLLSSRTPSSHTSSRIARPAAPTGPAVATTVVVMPAAAVATADKIGKINNILKSSSFFNLTFSSFYLYYRTAFTKS